MKIKCSKCNTIKECQSKIYRDRINEYGSESNLIKLYICRDCLTKEKIINCKSILNDNIVNSIITIKNNIKSTIDKYEMLGINNGNNRLSFIKEIEIILSMYHIKDYKFDIKDNKIKSILLLNIPFMDTIGINL